MGFVDRELLPGVHHVQDAMGVCFTLIAGERRALLVDAGYGLEDVAAWVRGITDLPVTLWLTHGHHDHALGARWFSEARLCPADLPVYEAYTRDPWLGSVLEAAREKGIGVDEAGYRSMELPRPMPLEGEEIDLGGRTARVIPCPGHTPGSAVVFVPQFRLLLTGDDWNPCTWAFFPEAMPVGALRENLRALLALDFDHVLCPHRPELRGRRELEAFLEGLTDGAIASARPVRMERFPGVDAREAALPGEQVIVFDADKARR